MVVAKNGPGLVCFENHTMASFVVLFLFFCVYSCGFFWGALAGNLRDGSAPAENCCLLSFPAGAREASVVTVSPDELQTWTEPDLTEAEPTALNQTGLYSNSLCIFLIFWFLFQPTEQYPSMLRCNSLHFYSLLLGVALLPVRTSCTQTHTHSCNQCVFQFAGAFHLFSQCDIDPCELYPWAR